MSRKVLQRSSVIVTYLEYFRKSSLERNLLIGHVLVIDIDQILKTCNVLSRVLSILYKGFLFLHPQVLMWWNISKNLLVNFCDGTSKVPGSLSLKIMLRKFIEVLHLKSGVVHWWGIYAFIVIIKKNTYHQLDDKCTLTYT